MNLRQNTTYQSLYGTSPVQPYLRITGSKLPTYLQVLLCNELNKQQLRG